MSDRIFLDAFKDALNALLPGWAVTPNGIIGPQGAMVKLGQLHGSEIVGHVDVQFILDINAPRQIGLWDCVCGLGDTDVSRAQCAAAIWAQTTAGVLLELKYSRKGRFADHYLGTDECGFSGWHCIAGAILGYGTGGSGERLQQWWLANPILPTLAKALIGSLNEQNCPYGIKILFGGDDIAEVRVNGECHEAAARALEALNWPRLKPVGFARSYVLILHPDRGSTG